jgi:hypothetical protein
LDGQLRRAGVLKIQDADLERGLDLRLPIERGDEQLALRKRIGEKLDLRRVTR